MSTSSLVEIIGVIRSFVGCRIQSATLLVWPDAKREDDVRLNLCFTDGRAFTLSTAPDGQTPQVEMEWVVADRDIEELVRLREEWALPGFWRDDRAYKYESFRLSDSSVFGGVVGTEVHAAKVVCFANGNVPTGMHLRLSSGESIYSIPGVAGNAIVEALADGWFPEQLVEVEK